MMDGKPKIVLFDDDEDILSICSYVLNENGWKVFTYTDCSGILARVRSIMPQVILMDNWIPDQGGIAATQTLKAAPDVKDIPVIYFSANSDVHSLAEQAGADGYLAKPFDLDDLERLLKKYR